nr:hypothetical protein OJOKFFHK_00008 [uncultured bacterium]
MIQAILMVRKVDKGGQIKWKGNHFILVDTLIREYVGLNHVKMSILMLLWSSFS